MAITLEHWESAAGTAEQINSFVEVGARIQAMMPGRAITSLNTTASRLRPAFAFYAYGAARHFVATRHGKTVGRCTASINPHAIADDGVHCGYVGMWECIDDQSVASSLLDAAAQWLQTSGCKRIVGPLDFSTWYSYRFCLGPYGDPGIMFEPYTPAYYVSQWESFGFAIDTTYFTSYVDDQTVMSDMVEMFKPGWDALVENGWNARMIDMSRFDEEIRRVYDVSVRDFSKNPHFTPIEWAEFRALYDGLDKVADQRFIWFYDDPDGEVGAFGFCIPNFAKSIAAMRGKSNLQAKLGFLRNKKAADGVIIKTIVVASKHQSTGVGGLMGVIGLKAMLDAGYGKMYHALMHDTNNSRAISNAYGGKELRRYGLFALETGSARP